MKLNDINNVIHLIEMATDYHQTVAAIYDRIKDPFNRYLKAVEDHSSNPTIDNEEILKELESEFLYLVSFIDKRNGMEANILAVLFGKKQAMRRANMYRFDLVDFDNRLLDDTIESDAEWADKDQELGTLVDTRAPYLKRMAPNGF